MPRLRCLHLRRGVVRDPRRAMVAIVFVGLAIASGGCGALPFDERPASGYAYQSGAPLTIAVIDEAGGDWSAAIDAGIARYAEAAPNLRFQDDVAGANIVVTVRRYADASPPALEGYRFQPGVAAFVAVYDADGAACNFPPSPLPMNCTGEIARGDVYLNDAIVIDDTVGERRIRLITHELGHAMGLTRHSAALGVEELAARYGW